MASTSFRQHEILSIARQAGKVTVEELAERFEVTPQTIRKDLNDLCEQRLLTRTHGGALLSSGVENVAYEARRQLAAAEKQLIGQRAAQLIPNNSSLFVNIGTTTSNTIGATSGGGGAPASIYSETTGTSGVVAGIIAVTTNSANIQNNTMGSIDASGTSATTAGGFIGIQTQGSAGVITTSPATA